MNWFRNLKLAGKIGTGFGVILAVTIIAGITSIRSLRTVRATGIDISQKRLPSVSRLGELNTATTEIRVEALRHILSTSDEGMRGTEQTLDKLSDQIADTRKQYEALISNPEERAGYESFSNQWAQYLIRRDSVISLSKGKQNAQARSMADRARPAFDSASTLLDALIELNATGAKNSAASATTTYDQALIMIWVLLGLASVVAVVASLVVTRAVTGPLSVALDALQSVAEGDLRPRIDVRSEDEIGQMGHALNTALEALSGAMSSIAQNAHALASSSEELSAVSTQMGANATETSAQANVVSAAAEQVSRNVQTVATGTEEMTASIREIAKNASEAAKVASSAVSVAETTNASVAKLGVSSAEIGNVIKVITSIAQQTNLLALNATIEAARAGEAGKGFAVVANEVKELAKETAKATEDISRKIEAIQSDTQVAVEAIGQIGAIIGQINDAQNTIASAVEEQTATTNEMARNVDEASKGSSEIAQNITVVAQAAESTTSGARDTQTAAGELARMAAELQSIVSRFRFESGGAAAVGSESAAGASRKPAYSPRRRTGDTLRAAA